MKTSFSCCAAKRFLYPFVLLLGVLGAANLSPARAAINKKPVLIRGKKGFEDPRLTESMQDNQTLLINGLVNYETSFKKHNLKFKIKNLKNKLYKKT